METKENDTELSMNDENDIIAFSIIRTVLWFGGSQMPNDAYIYGCYQNAKERFKSIMKGENYEIEKSKEKEK